jgi:hypothetical protein
MKNNAILAESGAGWSAMSGMRYRREVTLPSASRWLPVAGMLRLLLGVAVGGVSGFVTALWLPETTGPSTMSGMANIAYVVLMVQHVVFVSIGYGVLLPIFAPRLVTRPLPATGAAMALASGFLGLLCWRLDLGSSPSTVDRFARATLIGSALATPVTMTLIHLVGIWKNRWLQRRSHSD